jgi:phosphatidylglycerol:prolipoprotein diacylglycerol transferase
VPWRGEDVLLQLGPYGIGTHDVFVGLGVVVAAVVFVLEARRRQVTDDRIWVVVGGALAGGAVLARVGTWVQHLDLRHNPTLVETWLYGNRSILGGLLGAYAGAVLAKRLVGYRERTGDLFAPAVALGMAVGRIGCLLTERPGAVTSLPWGVHAPPGTAQCPACDAGLAMHPSFAYEIAFHLAAFVALRAVRNRVHAPGELLTIYLAAYAVFRFGVEFVRGNDAVWWGLSRSQWFLLAVAPLLVAKLAHGYRRGVYDGLLPRRLRSAGRRVEAEVPCAPALGRSGPSGHVR